VKRNETGQKRRLYLGICVSLIVLFGILGYLAHRFAYLPGDVAVTLWLQQAIPSSFVTETEAISYISSLPSAGIIVALVTVGLWALGKRRESIFTVALTGLAALINWLLKSLINRPRPDTTIIHLIAGGSGSSFPSGHVTFAFVFCGFLFCLAPKLVKPTAGFAALRIALGFFIALTIVSRLYLGAHWLSDTLGSLLLGGLLLGPTIALYSNLAPGTKVTPLS
jgi:undecaprenyl-diphosphatase